jgi:hypothetical protein
MDLGKIVGLIEFKSRVLSRLHLDNTRFYNVAQYYIT